MQKRAFKFNILDIVIIFAVICSIAVLAFHDTISELFTEPDMVTLEISVSISGEENVNKAHEVFAKPIVLQPRSDKDTAVNVNVVNVIVPADSDATPNEADVIVACIGYKKLGRYYTKSGERIYPNTDCAFIINGERVVGYVDSISEKYA